MEAKVAIVGSRTFGDYSSLEHFIDYICKEENITITEIISGGAQGADGLGELYARKKCIPTKIFKSDWAKYGKSAGFIRNKDIIDNCDIAFVFWDGLSKGTKNDIDLCKKQNKKYYLYEFRNEPVIEIKGQYGEWGQLTDLKKVSPENLGKELYDTINRCEGENIKLDIKQY